MIIPLQFIALSCLLETNILLYPGRKLVYIYHSIINHMEGDSTKKLTWLMGLIADDEMSGSLFWSFTYNAPSCKWLYVCIILFIIYECFFSSQWEVIPLTQTGRLKSSQQKFLRELLRSFWEPASMLSVSELLSCLHCCTVQPQEPYSRMLRDSEHDFVVTSCILKWP